jgi:hypothetical protein
MADQEEIQEMATKEELKTFRQFVSKSNPTDAYKTAVDEYVKNPNPFTKAKLKALSSQAKKN